VRLAFERELLEAGEEAGFVAERGSVIVVGVACFPVGEDDGLRAKLAKDSGEAEFVLPGGLDVGIGNAEVPRHFARRSLAALAASLARVSGVPRVPISPAVRSRMPVL